MKAKTAKSTSSASANPEYQAWLDGIVRMSEAARLRGVHVATIVRDAKAKGQVIQLSVRAVGMRRRHALLLD
jgi:hypothetical protein